MNGTRMSLKYIPEHVIAKYRSEYFADRSMLSLYIRYSAKPDTNM